jgi:hydroxymethylpyrimidine pyrophosphatase-like HAD family hydrolase
MRYHALATDYDGTLAHHGRVDAATIAALEAVRRTGRKLLLVTGRVLEDLETVFPRLDLFDHLVVENGAVLYRPSTRETRALADPPPPEFVEKLRARGTLPLGVGRVIVGTWHPHEDVVLETIRECGLELQVIFNKGAVMVLPSGVNKAAGLAAALADLDLSVHNAVGIGDAENDHAFLAACECGVAVANALPALKERAAWVTAGDHGAGVQELARALVERDLAGVTPCARGAFVPVGARRDGTPVAIPAYGPPVLIAGASGSGKSTLATCLLEGLVERAYQVCVIDPEGDYGDLRGVTVLGDPERATRADQVLESLGLPTHSCVVNLLGIPLGDRPAFFDALLPRLQELRARTGRPHWIVADEAHHLMPPEWRPGTLARPEDLTGLLMITVHPERICADLLRETATVFAVGEGAGEVLARFARAAALALPRLPPVDAGHVLAWLRTGPQEVVAFAPSAPRAERRRHVRKYATGDLGEDKSFWFRGPGDRLKLRARNLQSFLDMADGVDDDTWRHHLARGDYSRWLRDAIKDAELAADVVRIEGDPALDAATSRARIRRAIERRYTASA